MISYIVGKIISVNKTSITLENNFMGYNIKVNHPEDFEVNKVKRLYLYIDKAINFTDHIIETMYGFPTFEHKLFFLELMQIKGIGIKTAFTICNNDLNLIQSIIAKNDISALEKLEGINNKSAPLICDYFKTRFDEIENNSINGDIITALDALGYNKEDINYGIKNTTYDAEASLSDSIAKVIATIANRKNDEASN